MHTIPPRRTLSLGVLFLLSMAPVAAGALGSCPGDSGPVVMEGCPSPYGEHGDADHDGYSPAQGDCDDCTNQVGPNFPEKRDGFDNDCDGAIDEGTAEEPTSSPDTFATSPLGVADVARLTLEPAQGRGDPSALLALQPGLQLASWTHGGDCAGVVCLDVTASPLGSMALVCGLAGGAKEVE